MGKNYCSTVKSDCNDEKPIPTVLNADSTIQSYNLQKKGARNNLSLKFPSFWFDRVNCTS